MAYVGGISKDGGSRYDKLLGGNSFDTEIEEASVHNGGGWLQVRYFESRTISPSLCRGAKSCSRDWKLIGASLTFTASRNGFALV